MIEAALKKRHIVLGRLLNLGYSREEAEEAIQNAVVHILEGQRELESESHACATLMMDSKSYARATRRNKRRRYELGERHLTNWPNVKVVSRNPTIRVEVEEALVQLTPHQSEIAVANAFGYNGVEIGKYFNVTKGLVSLTLKRIQQKVNQERKLMTEPTPHCVRCDLHKTRVIRPSGVVEWACICCDVAFCKVVSDACKHTSVTI